jgi:DNA-binding NarL/FixJ family response regulator
MIPRILIVDDHEIVREGVRTLIARSRPDWQICGEASNGREALDAVKALAPDVVVMDVTMPVMSGFEAAARLARSNANCRIIIFTMHEFDRLDEEVRNVGAHGYVLKSQATRNLIAAIESVLSGGSFYGIAAPPAPAEGNKNPQHGMAFWPAFLLAPLSS